MSNNGRFNKIVALLGARGTGKTTFILGDKAAGISSKLLDLFLKIKKMKILIVCCEDSPVYRHINLITKTQFTAFKTGIARVIINPEDINTFCRFLTDSNNLYNTLLIFDDARNHSSKNICKELNRILNNTKQQNVDIFFMYHSFGEMPRDLYRKIDYIQLFKTTDSPTVRRHEMAPYYNEIMKVYETIKKSSNRFETDIIETIPDIRSII